jgi:hypothetical protein
LFLKKRNERSAISKVFCTRHASVKDERLAANAEAQISRLLRSIPVVAMIFIIGLLVGEKMVKMLDDK